MGSKRIASRINALKQERWKHFERLVAAVHQAADAGANVRWNEQIAGRQFDVTIRFRKGLYEHLTVIECKDYKHPVSIEKVEAFVTKSREIHANVSVLASASGFQSGATECAKRHGIILLHVTMRDAVDPSVFGAKWGEPLEILHIESITLEYNDGEQKPLPSQSNILTYYVYHTLLKHRDSVKTLDSLITEKMGQDLPDTNYMARTLQVEDGTCVFAPLDGELPLKLLRAIHLRLAVVNGKTIEGPYRIDPVVLMPMVDVENLTTGSTHSFDYASLPMGIGNSFVPGKFYEAAGLGFYYYCESVEAELADLWMVESFQHGQLIQARIKLETKYANKYLEVSDKEILGRLQRRRDQMKRSES